MSKLNFAFWGTPEVASKTLEVLKQAGYLPSLIVTGEDKPVGRKMQIKPSPVKVWAIENNIPVIHDHNPDLSEFDLSIVVAYGKIISEKILKNPKLGSINIHYSLLPRWRGASPVESAILNGDTETGVTIQQMEFKMDTGPILASIKTEIGATETAPELKERLIKLGGGLLIETLPKIMGQDIKPEIQDESQVTYAKKIKKEDGLIDPNGNAKENYRKFRAYAAWPRTYFFKDGKRVIVTSARLENDKFVIEKIIPEGGKETVFKD